MSILTKLRGEKTSPNAPVRTTRLNAKVLLKVLGVEQALSWKSITSALQVTTPHDIKRARQVLKGLVRQGDVVELDGRKYALAGPRREERLEADQHVGRAQDTAAGVVRGYGGKLTLEGFPIYRSSGGSRETLAVRPGDEVIYRIVHEDDQPSAKVESISRRSTQAAVGILNLRGRFPSVDPLARSFEGLMHLPDGVAGANHGDAVRLDIIDQDRHGLIARIIDVLPNASVVEQAIDATLESLEIPREWPEAVTRAASRLPSQVQPQQHGDRHDLTKMPLVTIDGATAKDFDDAVFAQSLGGQKGWRLIVAIADVANYVKPRSALDAEAAERTTSVYLPGHVVPMLPEAIANELCSLKPGVFRLALVCDMQVSKKGIVRAYTFYDALIRSHGRLTYEEVQAHLDNDAPLPCAQKDLKAVRASIAALADVHAAFRDAKDARGGLDFDSREGVIDIQQGHVTGVQEVARLQAHQIIEEAMINANVCAAAFIEANDSRSLYRLHEAPDMLKLETLRQDLMSIGLRLPDGVPSSKTYQTLLRDIATKDRGWLYQQLVLRSMKQAVYGPNNAGHFGLGLERYMHFTSPIRRYPDLLVHRAIKSILQAKTNRAGWVPSMEQLVALGEHCSTNERRAESAGWTVEAWLKCDLVKRQEGEELPGTIAGVTEFGLFVDLDGFFVQGLLHISDLGADYFRYDSRRQRLVGDRSGKRFTLGDALSVVVANVEPPQGKIELQLFPMSNRRGGKSSGERKAKAAPESKAALKTKNGAKADGKNKGARKGGAKGKTSGIGAAENSPIKSKKNARKKKQTTPKALKRKRKNNG